MTYIIKKTRFARSCLASMIALCSAASVHALETLSDQSLSDTTGEGIALLPENFKMVFQGAKDISSSSTYGAATDAASLLAASKNDTGFIRIIPTGENYSGLASTVTAADAAAKQTKADVFIYGLALSKSDDQLNLRYSNQGFTWGTSANPWLFRAGTESQVQQFQASNAAANVGYLALEAPLATVAADESDNNIKLGYWADAFSRKWGSSNAVNVITGAPVAVPMTSDATNDQNLDKNQRLRFQFVANGLSLNGSQVRLFQTQSSSVTQQNQTLGMASILRLNTNDNPQSIKSTDTDLNAKAIRISTAAIDDGSYSTPALNGSSAPTFNSTEGLYIYSPNINLVLGNMYQPFIVGSEGKNIILEVTAIPNVASIYNKIYTHYKDAEATYAVNASGGYYKSKSGAYYSVQNFSSVSTFYKKIVDTANNVTSYVADSAGTYVKDNVSGGFVELGYTSSISAPTKYAISNQSALDALANQYKGSTCNVAVCGTNGAQVNGTSYQGTNATHSSISMGTVARDASANTLIANRDSTATGIMFKSAAAGAAAVNLGSAAIDGVLIQHLKIKTTGL
ncbi:hypothetical protein F941_00732 [Acinetobacter bouvetii DSM 14964 = CIP 107468]|uniref:Uncharacterized protein n=1 Tax=Acinetobacter bouvetii DSM 14964 = CIP 107468 TaxID=1120925 RepID=N9CDX1_9GAMM|nr:hypothetical protein [Acinetobacter bouvetii]ENV83701.1 hypothetical protein F941_00732 [Acinetobacter bouvetii DSM 14964 = CIP 107468]BCU65622.1 hypothetical protein ACBO_24130 [Acinetobacter bouvetii]